MTPFQKRVIDLIGGIPLGRVTEYADISREVRGDGAAAGPVGRIVWDLKPPGWWRVTFCEGYVSAEQATLLREEGVAITSRQINPARYAEYRLVAGELT